MKAQRPANRPAARDKAERVYGLSAARAAFTERPDAVLSIAHTEALRHELAPMLRRAAKLRIAYQEVDAETLARMAQSVHHEGVCLLVRPKPSVPLSELAAGPDTPGVMIALDSVQNPHNLGAVLRSAAYFSARALLYANQADAGPPLSAAARRVAEGGAELVDVLRVEQLAPALQRLAAGGWSIVGSDARAPERLEQFRWPARSVIVLGHEQRGLSREVRAVCRSTVRIAGSERIDSLNVSVAAGILLASFAGAHGRREAERGDDS